MIKSLIMFIILLLSGENISPKNSNTVRLEKRNESKTTLERYCDKIAPYVLFFALAMLFILLLVILVKYGANITGTEANHYYNGNWR